MSAQESLDVISSKPNQYHLAVSAGSTIERKELGKLLVPAGHELSVHESIETVSVNSFSSIPSGAPNGSGQSFVDFRLPASLGQIQKMEVNCTLTNGHGSAAHVWEVPVMPFLLKRIDVIQNGSQVGLSILPQALWEYYGYTNTLNQMTLLQARTTIDASTYKLQSSQNLASAGSRTYSIDVAPVIPFIQAKICLKYVKQITLRFYIEDMAVMCPTNTNSTNSSITLTGMNLLVTSKSLSNANENKMALHYQRGGVAGRAWEYKEDVNPSFAAVSGSYVPYNTIAFDNDPVIYSETKVMNATPTGANMLLSYDVNNIYWTTADGKSLHNGLQHTSSELLNVIYPQVFPDNIFTKASGIYLFPAIVGSTNVKESLKTCKQLGFRHQPSRAIVNVNAAASATRRLVIGAFIHRICRVDKDGTMYVN